jgi:diguanylate cyclase (GGDEF)-like protein
MTPISTPAGSEDDQGGKVVPLHRGRKEASHSGSEQPAATWRRFNPVEQRDLLTSLHGHPWFEEDLRGAARRRRGEENPWVAIVQVEGLAEIDDHLGPEIAADALRSVAVLVRDSLRAGDKIARIGEDRFGLIVDAPYAGEAIAALERIERLVREEATTHPRWLGLRLRIGLAPLWSEDPTAAIEQAAKALEDAAERGGPVTMSTGSRPMPHG